MTGSQGIPGLVGMIITYNPIVLKRINQVVKFAPSFGPVICWVMLGPLHAFLRSGRGYSKDTLCIENHLAMAFCSYGPLPVISTYITPFIEGIIPFITSYN